MLRVDDITDQPSVERELAMIKVGDARDANADHPVADVFRARTVDVSNDSLIVEITGSGDKVERLLDVLKPYGVHRWSGPAGWRWRVARVPPRRWRRFAGEERTKIAGFFLGLTAVHSSQGP